MLIHDFAFCRPMNGTTPADGDKTQPMQSAQAAKKGSPVSARIHAFFKCHI